MSEQKQYRYFIGGDEVVKEDFMNKLGDYVTNVSGDKVSSVDFNSFFAENKDKNRLLNSENYKVAGDYWKTIAKSCPKGGLQCFCGGSCKDDAKSGLSTRLKAKNMHLDEALESTRDRIRNLNEVNKQLEDSVGVKETEGKTDYSEINLGILDLMAERFSANKHKYPKGNMKKFVDIKSLEWALFRHVKKMVQPIESDPETYEEHLAASLCGLSMILDQLKNNSK